MTEEKAKTPKKEKVVAGVTYQLMQMDTELTLHDEGEWGGTETEYLAFNDAGVEMEVGEFLYAFTRLLKPARVLETGTHYGIGAMYMGMGLKHNQKGKLTTLEFQAPNYEIAKGRMKKLQLENYVETLLGDVAYYKTEDKFGLILLDTEPQTRFAELVNFFDNLEEGGYVFIHDLHRHMHQIPNAEHGFAWPFGKIPSELAKLVEDGKLRPMHFPTPRGLTGFYKPKADDYDWGHKSWQ